MSTAVISYDSIMLASGIAQKMSEHFTDYADSIRSDVLNKLNSYSGPHTGYIDDAIGKMNNKIAELDDDSTRFLKYSKDLSSLKDSCVRTDSMVKNTISTLSQTFCTNHNIRVSEVESTIAFLGVDFINENPVGRFVGTLAGEAIGTANSWKRDIEEWYDYEGGKQAIDNMKDILIDAGFLAAGIALTVLTGGASAAFVAVSIMKLADDCVNSYFEGAALGASMSGDPATGRRLSKINSFKDLSRSSVKYGYDFENYEYGTEEKAFNIAGDCYDITENTLDLMDAFGSKSGAVKALDYVKKGYTYNKLYGDPDVAEKNRVNETLWSLSNFTGLGKKVTRSISDGGKIANDYYDIYMTLTGQPVHGQFINSNLLDIVKGQGKDEDLVKIIRKGNYGDVKKIILQKDVSSGLNPLHRFINNY